MVRRILLFTFAVSLMTNFVVLTVTAADPASASYRLDESGIGNGNMLQASSTSYRAYDNAGDIGIGFSQSSGYRVLSGALTGHDPTLAFSVNTSTANFGLFTPAQASTATATFSVKNYTSYGYVVQIEGDPPTNDGYSLKNMDVTGPSQNGVEQFGVNLVANTAPVSFGANPDNGSFGFGSVLPDYATANSYRYINGEIIAKADKESGETLYTISYLINVAALTPGGTYRTSQTLIVTGTY